MSWLFAFCKRVEKYCGLMLVCCFLLLCGCGSTAEEPVAQSPPVAPLTQEPIEKPPAQKPNEEPAKEVAPAELPKAPALSYKWLENKLYLYTIKQTVYSGKDVVTNYSVLQCRPVKQRTDQAIIVPCTTRGPFLHSGKSEPEESFFPDIHYSPHNFGEFRPGTDGSITTASGDGYLPYLFGPGWRVVVDRLPQPGESAWSDTRKFDASYSVLVLSPSPEASTSATRSSNSALVHNTKRFGGFALPPFFPSLDPSGRPDDPGVEQRVFSNVMAQGEETCHYRILEVRDGVVTIEKQVKQTATQASTGKVLGSGELKGSLKFDSSVGLPTESKLEGSVTFNHPEGAVTYPIKLEYKLEDYEAFELRTNPDAAERKAKREAGEDKKQAYDAAVLRILEDGGSDQPLPSHWEPIPHVAILGAYSDRLDVTHWRDLVLELGFTYRVQAVSPNGKWLCVALSPKRFALVDLLAGKTKQIFDQEQLSNAEHAGIAISGDGGKLAFTNVFNGELCFFSLSDSGEVAFLGILNTKAAYARFPALNQHGNFLLSLGASNLFVYSSTDSMQVERRILGYWNYKPISCFLMDGKGERAMTTDGTKLVRYDLKTGEITKTSDLVESRSTSRVEPALSPNGRLLFSGAGTNRCWITSTKQPAGKVYLKDCPVELQAAQFSHSGRQLYALVGTSILVWDTITGERIGEIVVQDKIKAAIGFKLSPDGKLLIVSCGAPRVIRIFKLNKVE